MSDSNSPEVSRLPRMNRRTFLRIAAAAAGATALSACAIETAAPPAPVASPNPEPTLTPEEVPTGLPAPSPAATELPVVTEVHVTNTAIATENPVVPNPEIELPNEYDLLNDTKRTTKDGKISVRIRASLNQHKLDLNEVANSGVKNLQAESKEFSAATVDTIADTLIEYIQKAGSEAGLTEEDKSVLKERSAKLLAYLEDELSPSMNDKWIKPVVGESQKNLLTTLKPNDSDSHALYVHEDTQAAAFAGIIDVSTDTKETKAKVFNGNAELETFASLCARTISGVIEWSATERQIADDKEGEPEKLIMARKIISGEDLILPIVEPTETPAPEPTVAPEVVETNESIYTPFEQDIEFDGGIVRVKLQIDKAALSNMGLTAEQVENKMSDETDLQRFLETSGTVIATYVEYAIRTKFDATKLDQASSKFIGDQTKGTGMMAWGLGDTALVPEIKTVETKGSIGLDNDIQTIKYTDDAGISQELSLVPTADTTALATAYNANGCFGVDYEVYVQDTEMIIPLSKLTEIMTYRDSASNFATIVSSVALLNESDFRQSQATNTVRNITDRQTEISDSIRSFN
jgi:TAT (twin-arginine translocation) pathway signal sequence